jgi:sugar lactone lactonase YvrE
MAQAVECPKPRAGAGRYDAAARGRAPREGNASSFDPLMNAETDVPKGSILEGKPNPFRTEFDWAKMPAGRVWGDDRAIAIDKDGTAIWVADRCGMNQGICGKDKTINPVMHFARDGHLINSFGAGTLQDPHGIKVDPAGNIWVTDGGPRDGCQPAGQPAGNRLSEFSPDGKLLRQIKGPINGKPFTGLNGVAFSPLNGDIFLADGHGGGGTPNNRILRFDKTGKFILEWGQPGKTDNDIGIPHDVTVDHEGRVYVTDRSDVAVKVYDPSGKLLHVWHQFGEPSGVLIDRNDLLYVADETATIPVRNPKLSPGVRIVTTDGKLIANVPYRKGNSLEGIAVDRDGNIYGANTNHPRAVRFMRTGPLPAH